MQRRQSRFDSYSLEFLTKDRRARFDFWAPEYKTAARLGRPTRAVHVLLEHRMNEGKCNRNRERHFYRS